MCSAFYTNKFNLNVSITNVSFDSDGKGLFSVRVLLEQKRRACCQAMESTISMCTNKVNSEQKYVLIKQWFDTDL